MKTVKDIAAALDIIPLCGDTNSEVCGCYCGDLLSWVMSHAVYGDVWITIMSNINVIAVASLTECACVIMAEGVVPDGEVLNVAKEKGITLFSDSRSAYELCCLVGRQLQNE